MEIHDITPDALFDLPQMSAELPTVQNAMWQAFNHEDHAKFIQKYMLKLFCSLETPTEVASVISQGSLTEQQIDDWTFKNAPTMKLKGRHHHKEPVINFGRFIWTTWNLFEKPPRIITWLSWVKELCADGNVIPDVIGNYLECPESKGCLPTSTEVLGHIRWEMIKSPENSGCWGHWNRKEPDYLGDESHCKFYLGFVNVPKPDVLPGLPDLIDAPVGKFNV